MATYTTIPGAGAKLRGSVFAACINEVRTLWAEVDSDHPLAASDIILENVTDLVLPMTANTKYRFWLCLVYTIAAGSTEDIRLGCSFPTGAVVDFGGAGPNSAVTASGGDGEWLRRLSATTASTTIPYGATSTAITNALIAIRVSNGVNAGNLQIMAAQQASGVNVVTVKAGSYLEGKQVT